MPMKSKRCIMHTKTILFAVFLAAASASEQTDGDVCTELDYTAYSCCEMDSLQSAISKYAKPLLDDCMDLPDCDRAKCVAGKIGYSTADGSLDKKKATDLIEKDFGASSDITMALKGNCVNGDLNLYGLPDQCEMVKFENCVRVHILGRCTKWDTIEDCSDVKEIAEDCFKNFK